MSGDPRELTREERAAIKKLVVSMCANYDHEYGCLPLEGSCFMLGKWWTGAYCKYFRNAVLPLDPTLAATLTGKDVPVQEICTACKKPFIPAGRQSYCSTPCRKEGNRRKSRERMRKKRSHKQV